MEASSLAGVSGVSAAAGSANFAVALDKEDNMVTAEETAVVKAAILESVDPPSACPRTSSWYLDPKSLSLRSDEVA